MIRCTLIALISLLMIGCRCSQRCCDPGAVRRELGCRTGQQPEQVGPCREVIPPAVTLDDGVSEDEAVLTALSNNSAFQAATAQLGMAHGDLVQAGLIANPQMLIYFPASIKEGQYTLFQPIESFLLRPARIDAADGEYHRVAESLIQSGLDLARDVRLAHADLLVATEQAELAQEAEGIRQSISSITRLRLKNGDISELETITARVDALNAKAATGIRSQQTAIAAARLASLIGLPSLTFELRPERDSVRATIPTLNEDVLIEQALACRPDYQAARWDVAAANRRAHIARWQFLRLDGVLDVRTELAPTRTGGGMRFDIPIFNRNQGGVMRAEWEVQAALHRRDAIGDQIIADVRTAARQVRLASDALRILEDQVEPALSEAVEIARQGFQNGGTDYLLILQTTTQYLDARSQILQSRADYRRALAELDRAVGGHLESGLVDAAALCGAIDAVREIDADADLDVELGAGDADPSDESALGEAAPTVAARNSDAGSE